MDSSRRPLRYTALMVPAPSYRADLRFLPLLRESWASYRRSFISLLPLGGALGIGGALLQSVPMTLGVNLSTKPFPWTLFLLVQIGFIALLALSFWASAYFTLVFADERLTWRRMRSLFWPLIGLTLWIMVRGYVIVPIGGFALIALSVLFDGTPWFMILLILGLLVVLVGVVPTIVMAPRLFCSYVSLILERTGVRESARRSIAASRGHWWRLAGYIVLLTGSLTLFHVAVRSLALSFLPTILAILAADLLYLLLPGLFSQAFFTKMGLAFLKNAPGGLKN